MPSFTIPIRNSVASIAGVNLAASRSNHPQYKDVEDTCANRDVLRNHVARHEKTVDLEHPLPTGSNFKQQAALPRSEKGKAYDTAISAHTNGQT